jgi:hypothetical protein
MKNLVNIITVALFTLSLQAINYNNPNPNKDNRIIIKPFSFADLNILSIKEDIKKSRIYYMTGSFTVLKNPKRGDDVSHAVDISFRNSVILSRSGSNYIQANAKAKRNDNNSTNEFRIYVHHDNSRSGKIDKRNIKVNWKTGSLEVVSKLANVSVIYQKDSILITGTMQKNGYTIGVNLAISKDSKLI